MIEEFCQEKSKEDQRFIIINSGVPIKKMLEEEGYPFKSKDHSKIVREFQITKKFTKTTYNYSHRLEHYSSRYGCPKILEEQFTPDYPLKISEKCCTRLKKDIGKKYCLDSGKTWVITGIRKDEGGARTKSTCVVQNAFGNKFNPLFPVPNEWIEWYVKEYDLDLCKLYYPPYNFDRTGCKGCPFNIHIQKELEILEELLPDERKQCEIIWKPVYDEYRRLNYRIKEKKK